MCTFAILYCNDVSYNIVIPATALQNVALNSTLIGGIYAYSEQRVIFTCISSNSTILEWQSGEHIGTGGDSIPIYSVGPRVNVTSGGNPNTYATRVDVSTKSGVTVIVSQLHIIAFVPSSVTCRINGQGPRSQIPFSITGLKYSPNLCIIERRK